MSSHQRTGQGVTVGFYRPDVYNQPEVFGLELVGSIDWADQWQFDIIAVFRMPETGDWFYAEDAGCSCPSPFEGFTNLISLTSATKAEIQQVLEEKDASEKTNTYGCPQPMAVAALVERMQAL